MTNDSARRDEAWPGAVQWDLGMITSHAGETVWQCEARRAGRVYQRSVFGTQAEAEAFALHMREHEPDQMLSVEAIKASAVWN
jgi:hypothetical protein